jgi:hypothetical protein
MVLLKAAATVVDLLLLYVMPDKALYAYAPLLSPFSPSSLYPPSLFLDLYLR